MSLHRVDPSHHHGALCRGRLARGRLALGFTFLRDSLVLNPDFLYIPHDGVMVKTSQPRHSGRRSRSWPLG